ncbi:SDR family NAD(P)-dependent oxidoreductase [Zhihengliuella salsuginis]|uniref:Short-chain dehydrogenase n=1 Tax=Zhihengliuella salsuginis TaxID=578222 RepID=A0ABQ3GL60_9MICC|nr:SDR family oxidoreductase [Zhihengliuella salsuginis]GHD13821.1 short-chain dehydrogenase [Zhihengliuella salsuginis]
MEIIQNVFVVTGGGNGIGREVVLQLLGRNSRVAAVDLDADALAETARLSNAGDLLSTHAVDITDREAVGALPAAVKEAHGKVDGLINVAGIIHEFTPLSELGHEVIERVMNVNFWGTVNTSQAFLADLEARPNAAIVNVSSMGALVPFPGQSAYGASKAAVKLFTEGLRAEHQGTRLAATVVFPGAISTNITANSGVEMRPAAVKPVTSVKKGKKPKKQKEPTLTSPEDAAAEIVRAVETGKPRVLIGKDAVMMDRLARLLPAKAVSIVAKKMARHFQ